MRFDSQREDGMAGKWLMLGAIGLLAVGAAPGGYGTAREERASGGYPACSRTVTDRCIQLYERGVRSAANLALNARLGMPGGAAQLADVPRKDYRAGAQSARSAPAPRAAPAMGGPYIPADAGVARTGWSAPARPEEYPACTRLITDRCIQISARGRTI